MDVAQKKYLNNPIGERKTEQSLWFLGVVYFWGKPCPENSICVLFVFVGSGVWELFSGLASCSFTIQYLAATDCSTAPHADWSY